VGLNAKSWAFVLSFCPRGVLRLLTRTQDEVCDFFEKLAWTTYDLQQARGALGYPAHGESIFPVSPYPLDRFIDSYDPSHSYFPLVLCDYCESSDHDVHTCPYRAYVDATSASAKKMINELTDKMVETVKEKIAEYSYYFSHNREDTNLYRPDFSLGSPKPEVSLYDDFESSYLTRPNLNDAMCLASLEKESDLSLSLSYDLAPEFSSLKDATNDFLVSTVPPTTLNDSFEFEDGEESKRPNELVVSITTKVRIMLSQKLFVSRSLFRRQLSPLFY